MALSNPGSDWKAGFLFLGNQLALDFLNTRPVQDGMPSELLPDFDALLRWFEAAELLRPRDRAGIWRRWGRSERARRLVEGVREFRERLRNAVSTWEGGFPIRASIIEELNRWMAERPMRTRLTAAGSTVSEEMWFPHEAPEDLVAPLAHAAADLFAQADRTRVRQCGNCVLHFLDISKKGTRRWCSMQLCGNRLKVAAYAARRRETSRNPDASA